jgi:2-haloalkanoic acid dehalogenase type II
MPYREIGHLSVRQVMDRAGIAHSEEEVHALVAAIERLPCFSEVPEALARLQKAYKLVVLSNGDSDMLETAKQFHRIPFDAVISVAEANAFKPHHATYEMAAARWVSQSTRCCSSPTMSLTASAPSPPGCGPCSSTADVVRSPAGRISRIWSSPA